MLYLKQLDFFGLNNFLFKLHFKLENVNKFLKSATFLILSLFFFGTPLMSQEYLDGLKDQLEESAGVPKIRILNQITQTCLDESPKNSCYKYAKQSTELVVAIMNKQNPEVSPSDYYLAPQAYILEGQSQIRKGEFALATLAFDEAISLAILFDLPEWEDKAEDLKDDSEFLAGTKGQKEKKKNGGLFKDIGKKIDRTGDILAIAATMRIAKMHEKNERYEKAIEEYAKVMMMHQNHGDYRKVEEMNEKIVELTGLLAEEAIEEAMERNEDVREAKSNVEKGGETSVKTAPSIDIKINEPVVDIPPPPKMPEIKVQQIDKIVEKELAKVKIQVSGAKSRAVQAERTQDYEKSLKYYKEYAELEAQYAEEKRKESMAFLEQAYEIETQEKELELLRTKEENTELQLIQNQAELKRQISNKRNLYLGLFLLGGTLIGLTWMYRTNKKEHRKLGVAYTDLEQAQNKLKTAEQKIKGLLNQQVSGQVADALLAGVGKDAVAKKFVCIMFLDIRNFTPYVENLKPEEIIDYQNNVLGFMMETITEYKGIVNQILGDGFMATFGAPQSAGNDCLQAYLAARDIMKAVEQKSKEGLIPSTKIGIGLHAGFVVTGNVGTKNRKQYSVTGNPVITASRLEQLNKQYKSTLIVSKDVIERLPKEHQEGLEFSDVSVKGRSQPVKVSIV